jgi:glycosyltransferase involved in cell wall biosynthesis
MTSDHPLYLALEVSTLCEAHRSGTGRYAMDLITALDARADVQVNALLYRLSRWRKRHLRYQPERARWYLENGPRPWGLKVDVVHGTDVRAPKWSRKPCVITLHDVFHALPFSVGWSSPEFRTRSQTMYARIARDADIVICISKTTQRDFLAHYNYPAEQTVVVPHGIDKAFQPISNGQQKIIRERYARGRPYILHVGALVTRKNIVRLLNAYAHIGLQKDVDVVLAGGEGDASSSIRDTIIKHRLQEHVHVLNYVPDGDLHGLYAAAATLAFPSLYEGFGLPVLEAMACETPVLTADCGGTAEVAGGHAVLMDPLNLDAISHGLQTALAMGISQRQAAKAHAATFTWDSTAAETVAAYRQAIARQS